LKDSAQYRLVEERDAQLSDPDLCLPTRRRGLRGGDRHARARPGYGHGAAVSPG
jgi:hypothetical protein